MKGEDPYGFILPECVVSSSQEEILNHIPGWDDPHKPGDTFTPSQQHPLRASSQNLGLCRFEEEEEVFESEEEEEEEEEEDNVEEVEEVEEEQEEGEEREKGHRNKERMCQRERLQEDERREEEEGEKEEEEEEEEFPRTTVFGLQGPLEFASPDTQMEVEADSYNPAFESDRSQSQPSLDSCKEAWKLPFSNLFGSGVITQSQTDLGFGKLLGHHACPPLQIDEADVVRPDNVCSGTKKEEACPKPMDIAHGSVLQTPSFRILEYVSCQIDKTSPRRTPRKKAVAEAASTPTKSRRKADVAKVRPVSAGGSADLVKPAAIDPRSEPGSEEGPEICNPWPLKNADQPSTSDVDGHLSGTVGCSGIVGHHNSVMNNVEKTAQVQGMLTSNQKKSFGSKEENPELMRDRVISLNVPIPSHNEFKAKEVPEAPSHKEANIKEVTEAYEPLTPFEVFRFPVPDTRKRPFEKEHPAVLSVQKMKGFQQIGKVNRSLNSTVRATGKAQALDTISEAQFRCVSKEIGNLSAAVVSAEQKLCRANAIKGSHNRETCPNHVDVLVDVQPPEKLKGQDTSSKSVMDVVMHFSESLPICKPEDPDLLSLAISNGVSLPLPLRDCRGRALARR